VPEFGMYPYYETIICKYYSDDGDKPDSLPYDILEIRKSKLPALFQNAVMINAQRSFKCMERLAPGNY